MINKISTLAKYYNKKIAHCTYLLPKNGISGDRYFTVDGVAPYGNGLYIGGTLRIYSAFALTVPVPYAFAIDAPDTLTEYESVKCIKECIDELLAKEDTLPMYTTETIHAMPKQAVKKEKRCGHYNLFTSVPRDRNEELEKINERYYNKIEHVNDDCLMFSSIPLKVAEEIAHDWMSRGQITAYNIELIK